MSLYSRDYTINQNENEDENAKQVRHRYDINRSKPRYGKYKECLNMILLICIKQHLSNI